MKLYMVTNSYIDELGSLGSGVPCVFKTRQEAEDFLRQKYAEAVTENWLCEEMDSGIWKDSLYLYYHVSTEIYTIFELEV